MKRIVIWAGLLGALAGAPLFGQENAAAEAARREAAQAEIKNLQARIEDMKETVHDLQKQIDRLRDEVVKSRERSEDSARALNANNNAAIETRFKSLESTIAEVDRKRQSDNEKLSKYIDRSFAQ